MSAVVTAVVLCIVIRYLGFLVYGHVSGRPLPGGEAFFASVVLNMISIIAAVAVFWMPWPWDEPWAIDDCGDRLWQLLHASRGLTVDAGAKTTNDGPSIDSLRPREIYGLGPDFSRRDLDHARRRIVWRLHPDRQRGLRPKERRAREEVLKQVNAAYDILRSQAA